MTAPFLGQWFNRTTPAHLLSSLLVSACLTAGLSTVALAQTSAGSSSQSMPLDQPLPEDSSAVEEPSTEEPSAENSSEQDSSAVASNNLTDDLEAQPDVSDDLVVDNLTDDQLAQIEAIFTAYQPQIDAAASDYSATLAVLNDLLVPETANLALTDARNDAKAAEKVLDDLIFERNLAIRSVLMVEQRQAINDYLRAWLDLAPADPVAVFPQNLVGLEVSDVSTNLIADDWDLVVETPSQLSFDRGSQQLDVAIGRGGEVIWADLRN